MFSIPTPASWPTVSLEELNQCAQLQHRRDRKYLVTTAQRDQLLQDLFATGAKILSIQGRQAHAYFSEYFDTPDFELYRCAQYKRRHRFKLRRRTYLDSGLNMLEVKTKTARGNTLKNRVKLDPAHSSDPLATHADWVVEKVVQAGAWGRAGHADAWARPGRVGRSAQPGHVDAWAQPGHVDAYRQPWDQGPRDKGETWAQLGIKPLGDAVDAWAQTRNQTDAVRSLVARLKPVTRTWYLRQTLLLPGNSRATIDYNLQVAAVDQVGSRGSRGSVGSRGSGQCLDVRQGARLRTDSTSLPSRLRAESTFRTDSNPQIWAVPVVIVETKSAGTPSAADRWLWEHHIRPTKISKYGLGVVCADQSQPTNRWHRTLRRLQTTNPADYFEVESLIA